MLQGKFPVLTAAIWRNFTKERGTPPRTSFREIRRVHWTAPTIPSRNPTTTTTLYGGEWANQIQQLAFIGILKNAHTTMGILFDDFSARIGGHNSTPYINQTEIPKYISNELLPNLPTSHVFTILRDPVDRFLSGTCQDHVRPVGSSSCVARQNPIIQREHSTMANATGASARKFVTSRALLSNHKRMTTGATFVPRNFSTIMDCLVTRAQTNGLSPHQTRQGDILRHTWKGYMGCFPQHLGLANGPS